MRRLTGTALFVAAFFLSAALAGKGCFLLADKCISAFARGSSGEEGAVEAADTGDSGGIVMVSDEAGLTGLVAIDAGHGGEDDGCYRDGVSEARVNLELAKGLSGKLQELGFDTVMLREDDESLPSLEERVKAAEAGYPASRPGTAETWRTAAAWPGWCIKGPWRRQGPWTGGRRRRMSCM